MIGVRLSGAENVDEAIGLPPPQKPVGWHLFECLDDHSYWESPDGPAR
ncbi:hypothetical protein BH24ACT26_BH24ACT26_14910 [soil metagenome]|jgi:hypothetical protein